jgi:hypothetical protein
MSVIRLVEPPLPIDQELPKEKRLNQDLKEGHDFEAQRDWSIVD